MMWWPIRFYLQECQDFSLGKVILEKWDIACISYHVLGQHFSHLFLSSPHLQCSEGAPLPSSLLPPVLFSCTQAMDWLSPLNYISQKPNAKTEAISHSSHFLQDKAFLLLLLMLNGDLIHTVYEWVLHPDNVRLDQFLEHVLVLWLDSLVMFFYFSISDKHLVLKT